MSAFKAPVFVVLWCVMIIFIIPFAIFWCYKIWILRNESFFIKRYPKLTILSVLWMCFWASILFPLEVIEHVFTALEVIVDIGYIIIPFSSAGFVLHFIRLWFLYYDYNYGLQSVSKEWKSKLSSNTNNNSNQSYWALNNKWLGKRSNYVYYIAILWTICCDFIIFSRNFTDNHILIYSLLITFIALTTCFMGFTAFRVRTCRDELYIKREMVYAAIVGTLLCISYLIMLNTLYRNDPSLAVTILFGINIIVTLTITYISTIWVIKRNNQQNDTKNKKIQQQTSL